MQPRGWRALLISRRPAAVGVRTSDTVRGKLMRVVLLTTAIAVSLTGIAMLGHDLYVYRAAWAADLSTEATIIGLSTGPALAFDDHMTAERNLNALEERRRVMVAALYSADGTLFASFVRPGESAPPRVAPPEGVHSAGNRVELIQRVERNGDSLGRILIRGRYDVLGRIKAYTGIFILVVLLSMVLAFFLSRRLQKGITEPLDAMASIAREIVHRRDYSLRATKVSEDEIGVVVDAFNNMLDEVDTRSDALERSNRALQEEIAAREATQAALSLATSRLASTMAAAEIGSWHWDVAANEFTADRNLVALYGLDNESDLNGPPAMHHRHVHPDDVALVRQAETTALQSGFLAPTEFRVVLPDGGERWMARRGRVQQNEQGQVVSISGLLIDITAQKRAEDALRDADRRKDEFLATLAHELRNPLAPIRHAVKLLESKAINERQGQWSREVISRQVQRMALLLDDLLDVSRITRGRLELRIESVNLESVVEAAVETVRPLIAAKHHRLSIAMPSRPLAVSVDPLRLSQALSNLLTNAAKYTDSGGLITLTVAFAGDHIAMTVKDTGIGFEPDAVPGMFEMFSQVDSAAARSEGGLGIGLALVKGLIALHGGTIEGQSSGLGLGSEFTIRLPRSVVIDAAADVVSAPPPATAATPFKVLIADDNRDAADSLGMLLEMKGHEVLVGHNGEEALRLAGIARPDVMILDIGMPDLSGYEIARRIRAEPWGKQMLLIAATGWGQQEDKARAVAAGFDHHLTKPVDPDCVESLLHMFSRSAREPRSTTI